MRLNNAEGYRFVLSVRLAEKIKLFKNRKCEIFLVLMKKPSYKNGYSQYRFFYLTITLH